jgi:hypothetical protein
LKKKKDKGPWFIMSYEQALHKASQVMRDHRRIDRLSRGAGKRTRATATPILEDQEVAIQLPPAPIGENPFGAHNHDVLCGRGAYINGHVGNNRLRTLALERKAQFDAGTFTEKRAYAQEVVTLIRGLNPPGRFLSIKSAKERSATGGGQEWEELSDDRAIHKACQVMRDIDRPDRKDREERSRARKQKREAKLAVYEEEPSSPVDHAAAHNLSSMDHMLVEEDEEDEAAPEDLVEDAVVAAVDKALEAATAHV